MVLPLFPEGGLTSSVITTVWVGVFILAFFNLRFGWVLSGLVVPGYLVPLLILRPIAAGVVVVEAVLTYLIVWFFSERVARGRFNALFGRDRFTGLILASIAVRVSLDGWALPIAAEWLSEHWDRQIDWQNNLQSFGLVVISLLANQLWKPGLVRGLFSFFVVTGLTWLVVRYGLMEFTNFRLSGVSYAYESIASSILASPKAYIILVLTAFVASQMNVRYGWDFSGILIPALIALQWYQPTKILSSFLEAGIIYFLAVAVMKLPIFATMTIEGARKLLLFFNVGFVYKLLLGHGLNWLELDVKTTDFYGFGYLLSTLIAIKAYEKDIFPRVMRNALEISFAGAVAGNIVGFVLALVLPSQDRALAATAGGSRADDTGQLIAAAAGDAHIAAAGQPPPDISPRLARELADAIELLASGARADFVEQALADSRFRLTAQPDGLLALARREGRGRDLLLYNPAAVRDLAVVVPDSAAQPGIAHAGLELMRQQQARWLVLVSPQRAAAKQSDSMLGSLRTAVKVPELTIVAGTEGASRLDIAGKATSSLDLGKIRVALPGVSSRFDAQVEGDRAVLTLNRAGLERLAASPVVAGTIPDCAPAPPIDTLTAEPDLEHLAFLRFEIAEPLIDALRRNAPMPEVARRNASLVGWVLDSCTLEGRQQWRLGFAGGNKGTYLFAPGGNHSRTIQAQGDKPMAIALAVALHRGWNSGALFFAPQRERLVESQRSSFGVIGQAFLRSAGAAPGALVQIRPAPSAAATLVASQTAVVPDLIETNSKWAGEVLGLVTSLGFSTQLVDRSRATAGLEVAPNLSIRYLNETVNRRYATIWVLPQPANPAVEGDTGGD